MEKKKRVLPRPAVLLLCSLLPFVPGYLTFVFLNITPMLVFIFVQLATLILWGALSWRLYRLGDSFRRHLALLHAVPLFMLALVLLQLGGRWTTFLWSLPRVYFAALLMPGFLLSSALLPEGEWLGFVFTVPLMAAAALYGARLKRKMLRKRG